MKKCTGWSTFFISTAARRKVCSESIWGAGIAGKTINITTSAIYDRRSENIIDGNRIIFGYVASIKAYKGFPLLKKVLVKLYEAGVRKLGIAGMG